MPTGSAVLGVVAGSPALFRAAGAGVAKIEVTQRPSCIAGQACVAHIVVIGSVTVTVAG
jgi:hypothetical protein